MTMEFAPASAIILALVLLFVFFRYVVVSPPEATPFEKAERLGSDRGLSKEKRASFFNDILGHLDMNPSDGPRLAGLMFSKVLPQELKRGADGEIPSLARIFIHVHARNPRLAAEFKGPLAEACVDWAEPRSKSLNPDQIYALSSLLAVCDCTRALGLVEGFLRESLSGVVIRSSKDLGSKDIYTREILVEQLLHTLGARSIGKENGPARIEEISDSIIERLKPETDALMKAREDLLGELEALRSKPRSIGTITYRDMQEDLDDRIKAKIILSKLDEINADLHCPMVVRGLRLSLLNPIAILLMVIRDAQHFGPYVRQGALSGLRAYLAGSPVTPDHPGIAEEIGRTLDGMESLEVRAFLSTSIGDMVMAISRTAILCGVDLRMPDLFETTMELRKELPGFIDFIHSFPFRMINEKRGGQYLGYLLTEGYRLQHWYRYLPPHEVGQVLERYLLIDDRTRPNSIGVLPSLLLDKIFVLPILYHEYLHFAGTAANGNQPIANEAEVWFREQIYLRYLFAKYDYSEEKMMWVINLLIRKFYGGLFQTVAEQLFTVPPDSEDYREFINWLVKSIYGERLSEAAAERSSEEIISRENLHMMQMNNHLSWCPEIQWPRLTSEIGENNDGQTYKDLKSLIMKRKKQRNHMDREDFERILEDPEVKAQLKKWNDFKSNALALLVQ